MNTKAKFPFYLGSFLLVLSAPASAETVAEYLRAFYQNPAKMMERLPSEVDKKGIAHPRGFIDQKKVDARFAEKMKVREQIESLSLDNFLVTAVPSSEKDTVEKLVEPGSAVERNLSAMQAQGLMITSAKIKPWADSYWPTYRGQIAYRYADPGVPKSKSWSDHNAYSMSRPASSIVGSGDVGSINQLSPAEKYDFVMGDSSFTLTNFAWAQGRKHTEEEGGVATWQGICHGWAGASHMGIPFIAKPTIVSAPNGTPVTFYPQDIKALQSMLWANGSAPTRFVSNRCTVSRPPRNAYGRVIDPNCFDTNPATWHLAVVNQLGRNQRSFVFDGTYDAEVWNFPLVKASYRYFNPQSFAESKSLGESQIPIERFTLDRFHEFRSPDARSVVGIFMDVTYTIEIEPGVSRVFDAPTKTVRYIYDLEIDANNNVIGGEWYSNAHPDFIWTFDKGAQAVASGEAAIEGDAWANEGPPPAAWLPIATKASSHGIPLSTFVRKLVDASGAVNQPDTP